MTPPTPNAAATVLNPDGKAPFLLVCDHARRDLPAPYGRLGLDEAELLRHIGWDIGALDVAARLSARFDAPLIHSHFSRLLIDCNRAPDDPTLICQLSDGAVVPGNDPLGAGERDHRIAAYHAPYHAAISAHLDARQAQGQAPGLISIHSFTPVMRGFRRPWHVGILWDRDPRFAVPMMTRLGADPAVVVGDNEPYSGRTETGYTIRAHGADRGLAHVLVEIRQDLIDTHRGAAEWATRVGDAIDAALAESSPLTVRLYPA